MAVPLEHPSVEKDRRAGDTVPDLTALRDRLDILWTRYLDLLDQYQAAQDGLRTRLASGFFLLAQANFKSQNRGRYGQDYYDERTKASRRCHLDPNESHAVTISVMSVTEPDEPDDATEDIEQHAEKMAEPLQQPSPPSTPNPLIQSELPETPDDPAFEGDNEKPTSPTPSANSFQDPLRWFGILIPRDLRSAQSAFASALDDHVGPASSAARGMRELEAEIRRLRKAVKKAEKAVET